MPIVTVAVSTFRESYFDWVMELIQALENQTLKDYEVVLIVNENIAYAKKLTAAIQNDASIKHAVKVVFNPIDIGIAHSRNLAIKNTRTPYLAYTDDDAYPDNVWLNEIVQLASQNPDVGAVTGPIIADWTLCNAKDAALFPKELYWVIGCTPWEICEAKEIRNGFASNLLINLDHAKLCNGFNEKFGYNRFNPMAGEEPDFSLRLKRMGKITVWNPNAKVHHRIFSQRLKLKNILTRCYIEGKTKAYLSHELGMSKFNTVEKEHSLTIISGFLKSKSLKAAFLLFASTIAVLIGFALTNAKIRLSRKKSISPEVSRKC